MTTAQTPRPRRDAGIPTRYAQSQAHIKSYYGLSITKGMPVIFDGEPGKITGLNGHWLLVRLDKDDPKVGHPLRCHPRWRMAYPTLGIEAEE